MHVCVPVLHVVWPTLQVVPDGVQPCPAMQLTQAPWLHTLLAPQVDGDPSLSGTPLSMHVGVPPAHERVPVWHGLVGVQAALATQAMQAPLLQTCPVPQACPLLTLPDSRQTDWPVSHDVFPVRQGFPETGQSCAARQSVQTPVKQTLLVPHGLPSLSDVPLSMHTGAPAHTRAPSWQGFAGVQVAFVAHATH